jgi:hypothetical protein
MQPQIDYAPALPSQKRRRIIRSFAMGIAALLVAALIIKSAPRAWRHVQILYWQHRAMSYTRPSDAVVYDDDPRVAAKLLRTDRTLMSTTGGAVFDFAVPWDKFYRLVSPPGGQPAATLFLHALRNANDQRRLVVVYAQQMPTWDLVFGRQTAPSPTQRHLLVGASVFVPGSAFRDPVEMNFDRSSISSAAPAFLIFQGRRVQFYAGQSDPHDESHFTIRGIEDGKPIAIEGWLLANDRVEFQ